MSHILAITLCNIFGFRLKAAHHCAILGTLLAAMMAGMLSVTPRIFEVVENDSLGYISFSAIRSATYPLILRGFELISSDLSVVIAFQCMVFVLSFGVGITMILRSGVPLIIVIASAIGLTFNIYFNAFHFSILTESLSFSLVFITTGLFALLVKQPTTLKTCALFLLLGILFTLKPATLPIIIGAFLSIGVLLWQKKYPHPKKTISIILVSLLTPICLENIAYNFFHTERASLLSTHLYGKSAIITALSSGALPPTIIKAGLEDKWMDYRQDVKRYLESIHEQEALCLQLERVGDYENNAYWHLSYNQLVKQGFSSKQIFRETLSQNPFGLIKLAAINRANFLCVSTPITNHEIERTIPRLEKSAFGPETRYKAIYYVFLIFGFTQITAIIYYLYRLASRFFRKGPNLTFEDQVAAHLLIWAEGYLWFVAIFSITNPRYLMLVFPMVLLALGLFLQQRCFKLFKLFQRIP